MRVLGHQLGRAALAQVATIAKQTPFSAGRVDRMQMCAATAANRPSSCRGSRSVIDQAYGQRKLDVGLSRIQGA